MKIPPVSRLSIVKFPDPVLKKRCAPIERFDDGLRTFIDRMFELMKQANGVGLAAPQVGVPVRVFVWNVTGEEKDNMVCVNPEFVEMSGAAMGEEGCLSLPGVLVNVRRATKVVLQAYDAEGRLYQLSGEDLPARVWQHETDHLNGRLIIDAMSPSDEVANRRAIRQLKTEYRGGKA